MAKLNDDRISTGVEFLDEMLDGGFEKDIVTTIYGPAGSGKTLFCLLCALKAAKDKKVIYIDTEGGFSISRLSQIDPNFKDLLDNIIVSKPTHFEEQKRVITRLKEKIEQRDVGLIIVDTISMLYRVILSKDDMYLTNRELASQFFSLNEIARMHSIPVLVTNQVYADFEIKDAVKMVGGDILRYGTKCLIEIQKFKNTRRLILKKHRSIPDGKEDYFDIVDKGVQSKTINKTNSEP